MEEAPPAHRLRDHIVARLTVYYVTLSSAAAILLAVFPEVERILALERARQLPGASVDPVGVAASGVEQGFAFLQADTLVPVALGMVGALVLSIPIAWVYLWTRTAKKYRITFAQNLIVLPIAIALVVFLVKGSLALAFSLAGIVAAVRWRSSLSETTDAAFMFIVIGIGLAAGVQLLVVAFVASLAFNAVVLTVWRTGFAIRPVVVDGWYVRRDPAQGHSDASQSHFTIRIYGTTIDGVVEKAESILVLHAKTWQVTHVTPGTDGLAVVEFQVQLKKRSDPTALVNDLETLGEPQIRKVAVGTDEITAN